MRRFTAMLMILALLCGAIAACDQDEQKTQGTTEAVTETQDTETEKETPPSDTTSEATDTEKVTESETETETEKETETEAAIEATLPGRKADLSYTSADGYVMSQYNGAEEGDYLSACEYYKKEGYELYSLEELGNLSTSTYTGAKGYVTVSLNREVCQLYLGKSADGASLPVFGSLGETVCETTVTQRYSTEINGMTYAIRLTDGSFVVIDGGYTKEAKALYDMLCDLNGSADSIHIRAWLITHSHGDHYQAFNQFSKDHASKVTLDYLLYSPVKGAANQDSYLNGVVGSDVARFAGAKLCGIHTGMTLDLGCMKLQILLSPEHIYKENAPEDFNETSVVCRAVNDDGSMIFLADSGINAAGWMLAAYGDALKSDMVQIAHHGCETTPSELYDAIAPTTCFWPCDESLFVSYRGELVKQHVIEAEYAREHLLHSYGQITRPLSYKAAEPAYYSVFPKTANIVKTSNYATNVRIEDKVLRFDVTGDPEKLDPYVSYTLKNVNTEDYNAIRIVVDADAAKGSSVFFTCGSDQPGQFSAEKQNPLGVTGACDDGKVTLIGYFGDVESYKGKLTSLRLDFGSEVGQTVSIYSIDMFHVDVD